MRSTTALISLALALLAGVGVRAGEMALPADSIYHMQAPLLDQNGGRRTLAATHGHVSFIAMFYSGCSNVCPLIVETLKMTEDALGQTERAELRTSLISLDPAHDTPAKLKVLSKQRHIDESRWALLTTDTPSVRKIAGVLGVQYRQLANGEFNHSSVLILLDRQGRIVARTTRLGALDAEFLAAARKALATSRRS